MRPGYYTSPYRDAATYCRSLGEWETLTTES